MKSISIALSERVFALSGRVFALSERVFALSEKVFALSERVFAPSERVFALDVRVECELMWQGQDGGPRIRLGKRARTAAKTALRRSQ